MTSASTLTELPKFPGMFTHNINWHSSKSFKSWESLIAPDAEDNLGRGYLIQTFKIYGIRRIDPLRHMVQSRLRPSLLNMTLRQDKTATNNS